MPLTLKDLPNVAITVLLAAVVVGIGATVMADLAATEVVNATNDGISDNGTKALVNVAKKLPIVGTITALAVVLGVVFTSLAFRRS